MKKFLIILSICSLLILDIFLIRLAIKDHYRDAPSGAVTATDEQPESSVSSDDSTDTKVLAAADSVQDATGWAVIATDENPGPAVASGDAVDTEVADSVEDGPGGAFTTTDENPDPAVIPDDSADTTVLSSVDSFAGALNEVVIAATKKTEAVAVPDSNVGINTLADSGSYVNVLSSEVGDTKMGSNGAVVDTDENPEPAAVPGDSVDTSVMANKVVSELEKILTGTSSGEVKQEDLAGIVSAAVKEGSEIDEIQRAVNDAMAELRNKEGLDIQPEILEFAAKSINEIVSASRDIAQGDPSDPYIQSLNAEVDETLLTRDEVQDMQATSTTAGIKAAQAGLESNRETGKTKSDQAGTVIVEEARTRTIVVLKGETLYTIARKIYGAGNKYPLLYKANRDLLNDLNLIEVGQVLRVPPLPSE